MAGMAWIGHGHWAHGWRHAHIRVAHTSASVRKRICTHNFLLLFASKISCAGTQNGISQFLAVLNTRYRFKLFPGIISLPLSRLCHSSHHLIRALFIDVVLSLRIFLFQLPYPSVDICGTVHAAQAHSLSRSHIFRSTSTSQQQMRWNIFPSNASLRVTKLK